MELLTIVGSLGTNALDRLDSPATIEQVVMSLHTPTSYWVVVIIGLIASRWLVQPPEKKVHRMDEVIYIASAGLFLVALLFYLHIRNKFIPIYAELWEQPESLLIIPILLGSSPLGAVLLILSWYYAHPIARRRVDREPGARDVLCTFIPMAVVFVVIGTLIAIGLFLRLV